MTSRRNGLPPGWHRGAPPSVGWYPASMHFAEGIYRWHYGGGEWSIYIDASATKEIAGIAASAHQPLKHGQQVYWRDRPADWPERSRT